MQEGLAKKELKWNSDDPANITNGHLVSRHTEKKKKSVSKKKKRKKKASYQLPQACGWTDISLQAIQ